MTAPVLQLHQLALHNTGRMTPAQIKGMFAVREPLLARILDELRAEQPRSRAQHRLIIGQRGMGKTMMLHRIAAELKTDSGLSSRFIPLVFAEEQYAVDRLSKFWLNCLDSLADALEQAKNQSGADVIDHVVEGLKSGPADSVSNDGPVADRVLTAFLDAALSLGLRPVLLVDNLQIVFERLGEPQQHALRELLMRPGSPILIGASPSPMSETQDYGAAFYDHFKPHYLRPLSVEEMRTLLLHLSDAADRKDVRQRVVRHPERLQVLRQLTGGNPRTTVTLFFLYTEDFAPRVFGDLENLLDRMTPVYKARFEELTTQQQVIASAVANHWDPVTSARLSELTQLPAGTVSAQIDRLEKIGFVERVELFGDSRAGFQLAERFFNIWFLMRSASRRQRREVEFLTRFIESFYEPSDRRLLAGRLMAEVDFSRDRHLLSRAVAKSLDHSATAGDLNRHAELDALRCEDQANRDRLQEIIDFNSLPPTVLEFDALRRKLEALVPAGGAINSQEFAKRVLGDRHLFMDDGRGRLASRSDKLKPEEIDQILAGGVSSRKLDIAQYSGEPVEWFSKRLSSGQLSHSMNVGDWDRSFNMAPSDEHLMIMVDSMPRAVGGRINIDTLRCIKQKLEPDANSAAWKWYNWGWDLHIKFNLYKEAEAAYREAIARDPKIAVPWIGLGNLLRDHLGRYEDAEAAYREAIARDPKSAGPWNNLGNLLQNHLGRYEEAEAAYREAIARDPKIAVPWIGLGNLLQNHLGRYEDAEAAYRGAIARDPKSPWPWNGLGNLFTDYLHRFADAANAYAQALINNPNDESAIQNLLFLQRDFLGEIGAARNLLIEVSKLESPDFPDTKFLQEMLFAVYDENWGIACVALGKAMDHLFRDDFTVDTGKFRSNNTDDWMRASAVLLHLDKGAALLAFLESRNDNVRLRPWYEALRAHVAGDRNMLLNVAPEVRTLAEKFYDGIARRLDHLPEKTRRRPKPVPAKKRILKGRLKRG